MPNIAFIHHRFSIGGIASITREISRYLSVNAPQYRIFIFVDSLEGSCLPDDMKVNCELAEAEDLHAAVERYAIDIVLELSRFEKGIGEVRAATGCKVIFADHGQPFNEQYAIIDRRMGGRRRIPVKLFLWKLFLKKIYVDRGKARSLAVARTRKAYSNSDAYMVLCERYRNELMEGLGLDTDDRFRVIENPVPRQEVFSQDREKLVLFVGRLSDYDKKVDRLLRIWRRVQDEIPGWSLEIVGDGYERGRLEKMSADLALKRVSFEGMQLDVERYYRRASILCLVSQTEGWPMCLCEGQSFGVIPIAFDCSGGVHTLLSPDGRNGFLVPPADEDEFARTLLNVIALPEEQKRSIRQNCIEKSLEYDPEKSGRKWLELFDSLSSQLRD